MSEDELAAWKEMAVRARAGVRPCVDCPRAFALEMGDCCNGEPQVMGRPRLSAPLARLNGRGRKYATEEERVAALRQSWRAASQRARAREL